MTQAFSRVCRSAGIEGLRLHDLRHEATNTLFEKGLSATEVRPSPSIICNCYSDTQGETIEDALAEAADCLEEVISP